MDIIGSVGSHYNLVDMQCCNFGFCHFLIITPYRLRKRKIFIIQDNNLLQHIFGNEVAVNDKLSVGFIEGKWGSE
jgi:hypothetical protein